MSQALFIMFFGRRKEGAKFIRLFCKIPDNLTMPKGNRKDRSEGKESDTFSSID